MREKKKHGCFHFIFVTVPLWFIAITVAWVLVLKWVPVYVTPLMVVRAVQNSNNENYHTFKTWKSLNHISHNMGMAAMASEDSRFLSHWGFDFVEIDNALGASERGARLRGASTISQQTAKNVFLFPGRTWLRKGFEAYFTLLIEGIWGKKRIMEVYLNVAEMGTGIFGAEAAAQHLFHKSADNLTRRQAALIAAVFPNPLKRKADKPSHYVRVRASQIQRLMYKIPRPVWLGGEETGRMQRVEQRTKEKNNRALLKTVKRKIPHVNKSK